MNFKKWESDEEWADVLEMFAYINKRAGEIDRLIDFITDDEMFYYARQNHIDLTGELDVPQAEARIANAAHVTLARVWLVTRGIVKTPLQVKENMFGLN